MTMVLSQDDNRAIVFTDIKGFPNFGKKALSGRQSAGCQFNNRCCLRFHLNVS